MAEADIMPLEATGEEHLASATAHLSAGVKLRAAREARGLSLPELSALTKINERHLAAVEDGDFAALPARIYAVGFARSYAGAVGLDGPEIAAQVRRELEHRDAPVLNRPAYDLDLEDPAKVPSSRLAWAAGALGIGLAVAGAVFWRSYFVPAVDLPPVREDVVAAAPELTPAAMISPTAESAAGLAGPDQAAIIADVAPQRATPPTGVAAAPSAKSAPAGVQSKPSPQPERLRPVEPEASSTVPTAAAPQPSPAPSTTG